MGCTYYKRQWFCHICSLKSSCTICHLSKTMQELTLTIDKFFFLWLGRNLSLDKTVCERACQEDLVTSALPLVFFLHTPTSCSAIMVENKNRESKGTINHFQVAATVVVYTLNCQTLVLYSSRCRHWPILPMTVDLTDCDGYLIAAPILCKYLTEKDHLSEVWNLLTLSDRGMASGKHQITSINTV